MQFLKMLRNGGRCGAVRRTLSLSGSMEVIAYLKRLNLNLLKPLFELWHQILARIHDKTENLELLQSDPYRMDHLIYPYPLNLILQVLGCFTSSVRFGAYLRDYIEFAKTIFKCVVIQILKSQIVNYQEAQVQV